MLEFLLYALLTLFLLVFGLPISIGLRARRSAVDGPLAGEISLGLYQSCVGLALRSEDGGVSLHIVLLNRVIRAPSVRFSSRTPAPSSTPGSASPPERDASTPEQTEQEQTTSDATEPVRTIEAMDWLRIGLSPALSFLRRFPRAFSLQTLWIQGQFGLDDPMQTGALYGYQRALTALPFKRLRLELIPDFCRTGFSGRAHLIIGIHVGKLLLIALGFALHAGLRYALVRYTSRPLRFF